MKSRIPSVFSTSVILPTLNEAENLPGILPAVGDALSNCRASYEIIVVDDSSTDGTPHIARHIAEEHDLPVTVLARVGPPSLAGSVVDGALRARYDIVVVLDADGSHDPREVPAVLQPVALGRADVAIGSRYARGGQIGSWGRYRRLVSSAGTFLAGALTGVNDPLSGFFACRRDLLRAETLRPRGYKILLEILVKHPRARAVEVPIVFQDRLKGTSKFGCRQMAQFALQVLSSLRARSSSERAANFRAVQ